MTPELEVLTTLQTSIKGAGGGPGQDKLAHGVGPAAPLCARRTQLLALDGERRETSGRIVECGPAGNVQGLQSQGQFVGHIPNRDSPLHTSGSPVGRDFGAERGWSSTWRSCPTGLYMSSTIQHVLEDANLGTTGG